MSKRFVIALPDVQPIAGNPYTVHEVKRLGNAAFCDKYEHELVLEQDSPSEWERVIRYAHECIHGAEKEYGIPPMKDDEGDSDVDRLAHLFAEMFFAIIDAQEGE